MELVSHKSILGGPGPSATSSSAAAAAAAAAGATGSQNNGNNKAYERLWSAYSTQIEIFIALRNVDYRNSGTENKPVKALRKNMARKVIVYSKPPGAMHWVEQCVTETVFREKSPKFATKPLIQYEPYDASAINLKFEVHDEGIQNEGSLEALLGCVEISLDQLINAGSTGLEIPIFSLIAPYAPKNLDSPRLEPGRIFIRGEVIKHPSTTPTTIILKFGLKRPPNNCILKPRVFPYYYEIYKLNEQSLFEITHQYSLIHRSELLHTKRMSVGPGSGTSTWSHCALPLQRVCNGDLGRIIKIEIYQEDHPNVPKGFVFTTLGKMLIDRELEFRICKRNGKVSNKLSLYVPLCYEIALRPFNYYLAKGVTLRVIYAVDFSNSNWNTSIHQVPLHRVEGGTRTPYEEAIIMTAGTIEDVSFGDSIFYSFGTISYEPYISTIDPLNHIPALVRSYKDALFSLPTPENTSFKNRYHQPNCTNNLFHGRNSTVSATATTTTNNGPSHGISGTNYDYHTSTQLSPLLFEILSLVSRRSQTFEYHVVFIYTDGQITDLEQCMEAILQLARLPISLIFIAIGVADLKSILTLEKCWAHPRTGEFPCRRIVRVIHFRSLIEWDSSVRMSNYNTSPPELFSKEIFTTLCDQMPGYMRIFKTTI